MNFTNPLEVSQGIDEDLILININTPEMFISALTGEYLSDDKLTMVKSVPR